jgi:Rad3-related DNA helicase
VLWFDPPHGQGGQPRLVSTQINLAGGARRLLTQVPFALVSGTVPKSLRNALGIADARFVDVGHPFDYSKQVKLKISPWSGAYQQAKSLDNNLEAARVSCGGDRDAGGGALCLFSSYKDMESVYESLVSTLRQ